jgi:4-hydroxythreonine-4-phosphate dehydrogenase
MPRLLILADDLSGAADCAIACIGPGLSAAVVFGNREHDPASEVLSIDCDTRHLAPAAAAERVARLLHRYTPDRELLLFKKIDSTLRGNVAAELAAILEVRRKMHFGNGRIIAVLAPAFPASGRTTVDGNQLVHGRLLHESDTWKYQPSACPTYIPSMLAAAGMQSAVIGLSLVRSEEAILRLTMKTLAASADVLVCDAETDEDLRAIAHASFALGRETIWAGSAGLAYHLPQAAGLHGEIVPVEPLRFAAGPTLIVIGSMSSIALEQVEVLRHASNVRSVSIAPRALLSGPQSPYAEELAATLRAGQDVLVTLEAGERFDPTEGLLLSAAFGTMMAPIADAVGALIASGGETARSILASWGVTGLRMIDELEPGLPFAVTEGWRRQLPVITKAGAFGGQQTLLHCWQFLPSLDRSPGAFHPHPKDLR